MEKARRAGRGAESPPVRGERHLPPRGCVVPVRPEGLDVGKTPWWTSRGGGQGGGGAYTLRTRVCEPEEGFRSERNHYTPRE